MKSLKGTRLVGIGTALPGITVTNADLEKRVETSDEWISSRTGIKQRCIVSAEETSSSLAAAAAREALAYAGTSASEVDLIVVATSTAEFLYPSTACLVQAAIGATNAAAFDVEAACTGIVYALTIAQQFIATGMYKTVVVVGVDVHSRFLNWDDRNTCILFGDGAGAFVLKASDDEDDVMGTYLRADGKGGPLLRIPNAGTSYPHDGSSAPLEPPRYFEMNGKAVYEFAINAVPDAVREVCKRSDIDVEQIDYFVPHQANKRIIATVAEKLGFKNDQIVSNIAQVGNTSAASIPIALEAGLRSGQIVGPAICALVGFGAGLTWGAMVIKWNAVDRRTEH